MIAVVADLHIGNVSGCLECVVNDVSVPSRTVDVVRRFTSVTNMLAAGDSIIIAGDVYHRARPSSEDEIAFFECLNICRQKNIKVYVIPGNHDTNTRDAATAVVRSARLPGVEVFEGPCVVSVDGVDICLMPHVPKTFLEDGSYSLYVATMLKEYPDVKLLVGHAMVAGSGYENELFFDAADAVEFRIDDFATTGIEVAILGHIHTKSVYKSADGKRRVVYPGSVVTNNFGELDDEKTFILIDPKEPTQLTHYDFFDEETLYREVSVDLITKDTFEPDEEVVRDLTEGAALRVIVYTWDYAKVDSMAIRRLLNKYGKVVKFEIRKKSATETVMPDSMGEAVHSVVRYDDLFKEYVDGIDVSKRLKKRVLEVGLELIESEVSGDYAD